MQLPCVLSLATFTAHVEILNRCKAVEYSLNRTMSPTMVAEYRRLLVPREVATQSLAEYCEFPKKRF